MPSQLWYQGDLHPAAANATRRLELPVVRQPDLVDTILAPQHPVTLVLADHTTDAQQSALEVEIVATLAAACSWTTAWRPHVWRSWRRIVPRIAPWRSGWRSCWPSVETCDVASD